MSTIERAIAAADHPHNHGAGYTLRVHTRDGEVREFHVTRQDQEHVLLESGGDSHPAELSFFNDAHVIRVDVVW